MHSVRPPFRASPSIHGLDCNDHSTGESTTTTTRALSPCVFRARICVYVRRILSSESRELAGAGAAHLQARSRRQNHGQLRAAEFWPKGRRYYVNRQVCLWQIHVVTSGALRMTSHLFYLSINVKQRKHKTVRHTTVTAVI